MAYKTYVLKGVVSISGYDKENKTVKYSVVVMNARSGSVLWRGADLDWKTICTGRNLLNGMNYAARSAVVQAMGLPRSTTMRIEICNIAEAKKFLPMGKAVKAVTVKGAPAKISKVEEPETKYAVVQVNGVWTIKAFQVPKLMTQEEAFAELLSKVC